MCGSLLSAFPHAIAPGHDAVQELHHAMDDGRRQRLARTRADLAGEDAQRWLRFAPQAVEAGYRGLISSPSRRNEPACSPC
jgi:hypothetical protein